MKSITICLVSIILALSNINAQGFWKSATQTDLAKSNQRVYANPSKHTLYDLAFDKMRTHLLEAPREIIGKKTKGLSLEVPMPDGQIKEFTIVESPSMQAGLQAKYPNIKSYKGYSSDNSSNLRLTLSEEGFFGAIASPNGTIYIDPVVAGQRDQYYSYYVRDNILEDESAIKQLACGHTLVSDKTQEQADLPYSNLKVNNEPVDMRIYRFAVTTTAEWTERNGGTVESGLAAVVMTVDRLNLIYENEVAIRLLLVDNNDKMIYTDGATDPFPQPEEGFVMLNQNTSVINNEIGIENYDVGHVYGLCTDTGGVARLASVCDSGSKGAGASCFQSDLMSVTVSVVAHEVGHMMAAQHTFNNCTADNMTLENETPSNAYEPGSGSTIMSYAGLCPLGNNVRGDNFDKYHVASLQQMKAYMFNGRGDMCAQKTPTDNVSPSVTIAHPDGFTIPIGTPFELTGSATDANGDPITYSWEQFDIGTLSPLGMPLGSAPSFESLPPTENPSRMFPKVTSLVFNRDRDTEVLPEISRDFTFRLTARDNSPLGGGTAWEEVEFKSTDQAGPFTITFPSRVENFTVGQEVEVTWDIANTNVAPVNCQKVDILFSADGGFNFDKVLALNTANDGSETIYIPNLVGEDARIKVKAADNVFFDISNLDSNVSGPSSPDFYIEAGQVSEIICLPTIVDIPITTEALLGYNQPITFEVIDGLPPGATVTFEPATINPSESTMLRINMNNATAGGEFVVNLRSTSGSLSHERKINLTIVNNDFRDLVASTPSNGASNIGVLPTFEWSASAAADSYQIEIATSPAFGESIVQSQNLTGTSFTPNATLEAAEVYYWRIIPRNRCSFGNPTPIQTFQTVAQACGSEASTDIPQNISASGTREIEAAILMSGGTISDLNVTQISGTHERVSDLKFTLTSPAGTSVVLANRKCGNSSNFDIGFDDQAPSPIDCPISGGISFQPEESLSAFNGESAAGIWVLLIEDLAAGSGGQLNSFVLENCGAITVQNPFIVRNDVHNIPPGATARISSDILKVDDENNTATELIYTIVTLPANGDLVLNEGAPMSVGNSFTQRDIDNGSLRYFHDGGSSVTDQFDFVVDDGEGGWISTTTFLIDINANHTTSTDELQAALGIQIFPNPVQEVLNVKTEINSDKEVIITLRDIQGRLITQKSANGKLDVQIHVKSLDAGIYFLSIDNGKSVYTEKVIVE